MKKLFLSLFLMALIGEFAFVSTLNFGTAQTYTDVTGVIRADTTWVKVHSPYRLIGPVGVIDGVTLNIEPGVQVYFNTDTYMQVNGTLVARGSNNDPVSFTGDGEIKFMPSSKSWNEKTGTGSIIENGNIPGWDFKLTINGASPKISLGYSLAMITINDGSPLITNSRLHGETTSLTINGGTPIISNNRITHFPVIVEDGSPIIFNNTIVSENYIGVEVIGGNPYISNNNITNCRIGISAAYGVIERNYIHGGTVGIEIGNGIIRNNTISSPTRISVIASSKPTITYNNFEFGNVEGTKNIVLAEGANQDINAGNNWWGTTDTAAIDKSIYDVNDDFSLGKVNYTPFLTAPNSEAMPDQNAPTPTFAPTASPSMSPTPSQESQQIDGIEAVIGAAIAVAVFGAGLGLLIYLAKRK